MTHITLPEPKTFDAADIANDILQGRCILLLGPDLLQCGALSVSEALRLFIRQKHSRHLAHIFEREGLFKFQDEKSKRRVQTDAIPEFFSQHCADEEVLKKILAIPFHLVLQVSPDTFLSDAAHRFSIAHQFKFFRGGKSMEEVEAPTVDRPLFYNLYGTKDKFDSMVLDFDDVYEYLKAVFAPPGLPQNLRTALDEANTFLFLGFQLEKWYTQLLIRWVSDVAGADRFVNFYEWADDKRDIGEFLEKHLNIVTTGTRNQFELLDDIHELIPGNRKRKLSDPVSPNTVGIRRAVQNGDLENGLHLFGKIADSIGEQNAATLLLSEFNELKTARSRYDLTNEQFFDKSQNLKFRLLEIIKNFATTL